MILLGSFPIPEKAIVATQQKISKDNKRTRSIATAPFMIKVALSVGDVVSYVVVLIGTTNTWSAY